MSKSEVKDISGYCNKMAAGMQDKLYFSSYLNSITTLVDFGCADAELLSAVHTIAPKVRLIGIDNSHEMHKLALMRCNRENISACITSEWVRPISTTGWALNLSSVIHEIYSYCMPDEISRFWTWVFNSGYEYIFIRDMSYDKKLLRPASRDLVMRIAYNANSNMWESFKRAWGIASDKAIYTCEDCLHLRPCMDLDCLHFLLKYRYLANWDREVKENYLPLSMQDLCAKIPSDYAVKLLSFYTLPYLRDRVLQDFNIDLKMKSHVKLILHRE